MSNPLTAGPRLSAEYVLPLRCDHNNDVDDLTGYLCRLTTWIDVTVVDGSDPPVVAAHRRR